MTSNKNRYRSPLAKARGLGSAKEGVNHWVWQRLTAIVVAPLSLWFVFSMVGFTQDPTSFQMAQWLHNPLNVVLSLLLVLAIFFHAKLGMQVIIEDYVHHHSCKIIGLILNNIVFVIASLVSVMSIISLHIL